MKKWMMLAVITLSQYAFADGFVCQTEDESLNVQVYNHVMAAEGTRSGSIMVLSDPSVGYGRKTIAKFTDVKGTLASKELTYVAKVDLRFTDSRAKGENVGGTKLGQLDLVILALDFSYGAPQAHGEEVLGFLTLQKRNGEEITHNVVCSRYLKN